MDPNGLIDGIGVAYDGAATNESINQLFNQPITGVLTMVLLGRSSKKRRRFSARVRGAGRWLCV